MIPDIRASASGNSHCAANTEDAISADWVSSKIRAASTIRNRNEPELETRSPDHRTKNGRWRNTCVMRGSPVTTKSVTDERPPIDQVVQAQRRARHAHFVRLAHGVYRRVAQSGSCRVAQRLGQRHTNG